MKTMLLTLILITCAGFSLQAADIPGFHFVVSSAYEGTEPITLFNQLNGWGSDFTLAMDADGGIVDATITLLFEDEFLNPIPDFPKEDMWLESADGGLVPCMGGSSADQNTDENGLTYWGNPLVAGGYSQAACVVVVNGNPLTEQGLPIQFNSPDINGDWTVNLMDVGAFSTNLYGPYHFRSDLYFDGVTNLADVGRLAAGIGTACP